MKKYRLRGYDVEEEPGKILIKGKSGDVVVSTFEELNRYIDNHIQDDYPHITESDSK